MRQEDFQDFLRLVRRRNDRRPVWMLIDEAPCHIAKRSLALAAQLDIRFIFLPKQCSELNAVDQVWKELKGQISANYQFASIEEHVRQAEEWLMSLAVGEALRKVSVLTKNNLLRSFCNSLWLFT
jgi:transposase